MHYPELFSHPQTAEHVRTAHEHAADTPVRNPEFSDAHKR